MKIVVKGLLVGFISKYMNEIFIKSKLNNTDKNNNLEVKEKDMLSINSNYVSYLKIFDIEDLSFPFNADSGKYWQYTSDQVMGGVSDGQVTLDQDGKPIMQDLQAMLVRQTMVALFSLALGSHLQTLKRKVKTFKVFDSR